MSLISIFISSSSINLILILNYVCGLPALQNPSTSNINNNNGITHLSGNSDYRAVKLHWDWIKSDDDDALRAFQVHYCELQSWGPHRCRSKTVTDDSEHNSITNNRESKSYSTSINGLRMATTYTFEVKPIEENNRKENRNDRSSEEFDDIIHNDNENQDLSGSNSIVLDTKGFSARATLCLPTVSEVDVETGPYFGGRISVENSDGKERCSIEGLADSARDTYTLRINHEECGSVVNETTVATFIIVQENLPILTHSTRRFLVLCTFQPDTLTVRAGINLPTAYGHGSSQIESIPYENMINEVRQQRQMRQLSAEVVTEKPFSHFLLMVIVIICGIFGVTVFVLRAHQKRLMAAALEVDTLSITSSSTESPFSDTDSVASTVEPPVLKPQEGDVFTVNGTITANSLTIGSAAV